MLDRNKLLKQIYASFNKSKISYTCIGSPFYLSASDIGDIDILVTENDVSKACDIITSIIKTLENNILFIKESPGTSSYTSKKYLLTFSAEDTAILQIDIFTSYHWRGLSYFSYHDAIQFSKNTEEVIVCNLKISALVGAFKDMVYGKKIKDSRFTNGYTKEDLISLFSKLGYRRVFLQRFLENYDNKKYLPLVFFQMWLGKFHFHAISMLFCYFINFVRLYFLPSRRQSLIAFYGPDGGGKSSAIDIIASAPIIVETFGRVVVRHTRPHIIPPISKFIFMFFRNKKLKGVVARSVTPINPIKAIILFFYYSIDFLIEKIRLLVILFSKKKILYIYDRYVFEFGYQQTFSKLPKVLLKFLKYFAIKPTINYYISADSKIIISRKSELKQDDIDIQNSSFKKLNRKLNLASVFIDSGHLNQKATADKILQSLSQKLL